MSAAWNLTTLSRRIFKGMHAVLVYTLSFSLFLCMYGFQLVFGGCVSELAGLVLAAAKAAAAAA